MFKQKGILRLKEAELPGDGSWSNYGRYVNSFM